MDSAEGDAAFVALAKKTMKVYYIKTLLEQFQRKYCLDKQENKQEIHNKKNIHFYKVKCPDLFSFLL